VDLFSLTRTATSSVLDRGGGGVLVGLGFVFLFPPCDYHLFFPRCLFFPQLRFAFPPQLFSPCISADFKKLLFLFLTSATREPDLFFFSLLLPPAKWVRLSPRRVQTDPPTLSFRLCVLQMARPRSMAAKFFFLSTVVSFFRPFFFAFFFALRPVGSG